MSDLTKIEVQNIVHLKEFVQKNVHQLIAIRKESGFSQDFIAQWLDVDRRKIIALESGNLDIELLCHYADKLDVDIYFNLS